MEVRAKNKRIQYILEAVCRGDIESLEGSFSNSNDKKITNHELRTAVCNSGCTALHWAAGTNQIAVMEYLVYQRKVFDSVYDVLAVKKSIGRTPLHYSCRNGCLEASKWLVEVGRRQMQEKHQKQQQTNDNHSATGKMTSTSATEGFMEQIVNPRAKHGVTPFQLAVWQNQLEICKWLVEEHNVDPCQVNDFDCGAVHWLGISPYKAKATNNATGTASSDGEIDTTTTSNEAQTTTSTAAATTTTTTTTTATDLIPLAKWLAKQPGVNFCKKQRQGHTPLHKAAWGGHLELVKYLRDVHGLWDDSTDDAGNYAADLADMAQTPRHARIAKYLREYCSRERARSCAILGVPPNATEIEIRKAYWKKALQVHPDRIVLPQQEAHATTKMSNHNIDKNRRGQEQDGKEESKSRKQNYDDEHPANDFDAVRRAYEHLIKEGGVGKQFNPAHSLKLMLQVSNEKAQKSNDADISTDEYDKENDDKCFKARLIAVLLEYGEKGLDLSNVKKKWNQVWPDEAFPAYSKYKVSLSGFLKERAGDVIDLVYDSDRNDSIRVFTKKCSRAQVHAMAAATVTVPSIKQEITS